jgi:hypothetical protein
MHARRASAGGGALTLVSKIEVVDHTKPLHVISTDANVTEVYADGLTIIRAARLAKVRRGRRRVDQGVDLGLTR